MRLFGKEINFGAKAAPTSSSTISDVYKTNGVTEDGIFKSYIPNFLYKPPFGYPRKENIPLIRQLARSPYIYSVIKTLADEIASTDWSIVLKDGIEMTPELENLKQEITNFFHNPNKNKESFKQLLRAATKDVLELDSGIWVKVFNQAGEFSQMFARDGGSFLKNPDIYGYMGNRSDYVEPMSVNYATVTPEGPDWQVNLQKYSQTYKDTAAYYQYGWTAASLPVPFGRREVVYLMANPQTSSIYGISPVQILSDVILTLIYGSYYNLDFYQNNNMPEGIVTLLGANQEQVTAFRQRMNETIRKTDENTGFMRKIGFRVPIVNQQADFKSFQLDPQTMQILEQQSWFTKIVWMCFGVTADEMGFTENSNKATGQNQLNVYKRKAVRPLLELFKYHIDLELLPEWGDIAFKSFEFKWNDYDLDEDIKKHTLYEAQLRMGIITPEIIAKEEGIDYNEVKEYKAEKHALDMEQAAAQAMRFNQNIGQQQEPKNPNTDNMNDNLKSVKAESFENELEKELVKAVKERTREINKALDQYKNGELDKIR